MGFGVGILLPNPDGRGDVGNPCLARLGELAGSDTLLRAQRKRSVAEMDDRGRGSTVRHPRFERAEPGENGSSDRATCTTRPAH
jgi:hypothetical protein